MKLSKFEQLVLIMLGELMRVTSADRRSLRGDAVIEFAEICVNNEEIDTPVNHGIERIVERKRAAAIARMQK